MAAVFAVRAALAFTAFADSSQPIASMSATDAIGYGQYGGPDLTSLTAVVTAEGNLNLSMALTSGVFAGQQIDFDVQAPGGAELRMIGWSSGPSNLYELTKTAG